MAGGFAADEDVAARYDFKFRNPNSAIRIQLPLSDLQTLTSLFYPSVETLGQFAVVDSSDLPEEYQSLLDHHDHMTVTLEAWHNSLVDIRVLQEHCEGDYYARAILLACQRDGAVVQFGIMRINLAELPEIVRLEIESQALPLGRIMIRHHLLREVELLQLWHVQPNEELRRYLKVDAQSDLYGRSARIMVEGKPAVELLEIVKAGKGIRIADCGMGNKG